MPAPQGILPLPTCEEHGSTARSRAASWVTTATFPLWVAKSLGRWPRCKGKPTPESGNMIADVTMAEGVDASFVRGPERYAGCSKFARACSAWRTLPCVPSARGRKTRHGDPDQKAASMGFPGSFSLVIIETRKPISCSQYEAISVTCVELYSGKSTGKDKLSKLPKFLTLSERQLFPFLNLFLRPFLQ